MTYFSELPYITYQFPDDVLRLYKNISIRPGFIKNVLATQGNVQSYTIQEGETPEIIAYNFYGDVNLHWIIMLANNIHNIYTDWPKTTRQLDDYLFYKYNTQIDENNESIILTREETRQYIQFIGTSDSDYKDTLNPINGNSVITLKPKYFEDINNIIYSYDTIINDTLKNAYGSPMTPPDVTPVSIYEDELRQNESKKNINILNHDVINKIKNDLRKVLND